MFDPSSFAVGGVSLIVLVFGLVEFLKSVFSLDGKKVTVLAAVLGMVMLGLYQVNAMVPAPYSQIYEIVVTSLAFGLAASGYYKFLDARLPKQ